QCFPGPHLYGWAMVERITRNGLLTRVGGFAIAALGLGALRGGGTARAASGGSCILTPEMTEGPYYLAGEKLRRNITEGRPGTRLDLRLQVVNATTCAPISGA